MPDIVHKPILLDRLLEQSFVAIAPNQEKYAVPGSVKPTGLISQVADLQDLNQKRLVKIRRLREGIRHYQQLHENNKRLIRQKDDQIAHLNLQVTKLAEKLTEIATSRSDTEKDKTIANLQCDLRLASDRINRLRTAISELERL